LVGGGGVGGFLGLWWLGGGGGGGVLIFWFFFGIGLGVWFVWCWALEEGVWFGAAFVVGGELVGMVCFFVGCLVLCYGFLWLWGGCWLCGLLFFLFGGLLCGGGGVGFFCKIVVVFWRGGFWYRGVIMGDCLGGGGVVGVGCVLNVFGCGGGTPGLLSREKRNIRNGEAVSFRKLQDIALRAPARATQKRVRAPHC